MNPTGSRLCNGSVSAQGVGQPHGCQALPHRYCGLGSARWHGSSGGTTSSRPHNRGQGTGSIGSFAGWPASLPVSMLWPAAGRWACRHAGGSWVQALPAPLRCCAPARAPARPPPLPPAPRLHHPQHPLNSCPDPPSLPPPHAHQRAIRMGHASYPTAIPKGVTGERTSSTTGRRVSLGSSRSAPQGFAAKLARRHAAAAAQVALQAWGSAAEPQE